ncbi:CaiB/BaiF CoA-transferase family protein [Streptomyces sp. ST2-7A]|uniref:CaiB/BaiF CoA transferase family protein n=1 Tax=Streptomyces sp. ST2-7A TaxID=2907214 RepID=UPI001F3ED4F1|nr:CaiB/BaiF CoA-transferase family protein [Streptomyces sp. ST2-7A]MCE7081052.1 CoA transferase [Streptomyces sp. ST2-7A]
MGAETDGDATADAARRETDPEPGDGPLAGVRVVELAGIGPGPFAAMILGDLGADVVRVDRPGSAWPHIDPRWDTTNRNKRSVLLDLKREGAAERVLELAERADVLLEGYRPGVAERLGVGPDACLARNPRLVYGRMTGWGQDGPLARRAGHDIDYVAITGALGVIGPADGRPAVPANLLGDYAGGSLYLVVGVLAALHRVRAGGAGQVVDAAIVDGTAHLTTMLHGMMAAGAWHDRREANLLDGGTPWYDTYAAADGRYLAVGPLEPRFRAEFLELLGLADDPVVVDHEDPDRWPGLRAAIADRMAGRTRDEWVEVFADTEACVAPVLSLREAPHHPHLAARGTFVEHGGLVQPAPAPRFSATPGAVRRGPSRPGADAAGVARDWGLPGLAEATAPADPASPDAPGA